MYPRAVARKKRTKEERAAYFVQRERVRKMVAVTLSDEARERLERIAAARGETKSAVVETLIMEATIRA